MQRNECPLHLTLHTPKKIGCYFQAKSYPNNESIHARSNKNGFIHIEIDCLDKDKDNNICKLGEHFFSSHSFYIKLLNSTSLWQMRLNRFTLCTKIACVVGSGRVEH